MQPSDNVWFIAAYTEPKKLLCQHSISLTCVGDHFYHTGLHLSQLQKLKILIKYSLQISVMIPLSSICKTNVSVYHFVICYNNNQNNIDQKVPNLSNP